MDLGNLDDLNVERVWNDARKILDTVGFEVPNDAIRRKLAALPEKAGRICVPPKVAEHYADEIRTRFGSEDTGKPLEAPAQLTICPSPLNTFWLDPADGQTKPHTTRDVVCNTKLVCQLTSEGLIGGGVAGVPQDVPPEMQFLMTHYIDCLYNPHAGAWCLLPTEGILRHVFAIAEVMGFSRHIGAQTVSPMKFEGSSIDIAVQYGRPGVAVSNGPMPTLGVTAPSDWHAAWAQCAAENVGGYALLRECGLTDVGAPPVRLFVPNPAAATIYFSSPQHIFALLGRVKVRAFFGLSGEWSEMLLVAAKAPDAQAAAEKTLGCVLGKVLGFGMLEGAGGLWMDEIFSPQQLLIDIEIKHMVDGIQADFDEAPQNAVSLVREGIESGSFLSQDLTLDRFREFAWESRLFDLRPRGAWDGDHQTLLKKAAAVAEEKAAAWDYELTGDKRRILEKILARAKTEFGCNT